MAPFHSCPCRTACTPRCFTTKEFTCQHPGPLLSWQAPGLHSLFCRLCRSLGFASCLEGMDLPARFWASPNGFQSTQQHPPRPHLPPPHLLGRKMTPWSSVQKVPQPLHSLAPPLLPQQPLLVSPLTLNSLAPLLLFFSLSNSLISPPDQLDLSLASVPVTLGLYPPLPTPTHHTSCSSAQELCKVPLWRKKPCLKVV